MKLHLPVSLRKSVLACILATTSLFPSISISAAGWGIAVCMLGSPSAKAETSTVTISASGKSELISTPDDSLIIMNLNRGYLYGSSTLNSSFDVAADVQIDSLIISDGYKLNTYHFSGDICGSGTFERTSDAKGANQTYVFTGDMSQYSGDMKFSRENDGNTFKFIGNQSGTGHITIAAGNSIAVDGAVMNNSSITSAGTFMVRGDSFIAGDVTSTGTLNVSGNASFAGDVSSTGVLNVNGSVSLEGAVCSNGSLVMGADAMLTNKGSFTFGEEATINLVRAVAAEDAQRTLTYTILSSTGTGTSNLSSLTLERIVGIQSVGRNWSFNDDGTLVGVLNNNALSYSGGNLVWNTSTASFSNGSDTATFTQGDDVTFSGNSSVTFGEALSAQRVTVANGAEVTISGGTGSLALAEAVVNGTLKLNKGGQNGAFSGNVDVYGTLSVETGDVTGWSGTDGIKSIDIFAGGEMYVGVSNNQTGAGLAINLQGGSISGVSGSNLDLGYGGTIYGYSSISALAADDATAEAPTVSTISGTNLTLRQNHTTISVAENARLDISSGILVKGNKSDLNGEGAVPSHLQAGLVKTGAGELRLSGNNTYTQATTVTEGSLTLTGGASMASDSVTVNDGAFFHLATESGLSASVAGILSGNGTLRKTGLGSASIGGLADSFAGHIELQQGTLSVASPVVISSGRELSLGMSGALLDSDLSLGDGKLSIDYSGSGAATSLNNSALTLLGGTLLNIIGMGGSYGQVYNLFSEVGTLLNSDGTALILDDTNNALSNYFAISNPGSGLWENATLSLTETGILQLVRYNQPMKAAVTITARQKGEVDYQFFEGVIFKGIYSSSSSSSSGAIEGTINASISICNNGSVTFSGNKSSSSSGGGAIYGSNTSTITLNNNSSVTFSDNNSYYANGGAIYGSLLTLSGNGTVTFSENDAYSGGAIDSSTVKLIDNESVTFIDNSASDSTYYAYGGAIYGGIIEFSDNGTVSFIDNIAKRSYYSYGGAIYGSSIITLSDNEEVIFKRNMSSGTKFAYGGAIYGGSESAISLSNNGNVTFIENESITGRGGAIYGDINSTITLSNNGDVTFNENLAASDGGAIYGSTITLSDNRNVIFTGNSAASAGGAISGESNSSITLTNNGNIVFIGNTASDAGGGAISGDSITLSGSKKVAFTGNLASWGGAVSGSITMCDNCSIEFCENTASAASGGAISGMAIVLNTNESVLFRGNTATGSPSAYGGAISNNGAKNGIIELIGNGIVSFEGNSSSGYGGAIYGSSIMLSNNGAVVFAENESSATYYAYGGAIYLLDFGMILFSDNSSIEFRRNKATGPSMAFGGAIYDNEGSTITLQGNNGKVAFSENSAIGSYYSHGGAIYGSSIMLSNNGTVIFNRNQALASTTTYQAYYCSSGGAIYSTTITLSGNDAVIFTENSALHSSSYTYGGAIYGNASGVILLSDNGSVEFSLNSASGYAYSYGGAICGASITLSDNEIVSFTENSSAGSSPYGGAIYGDTIEISNNETVAFTGNFAFSNSFQAYGGAINSDTIEISNNETVAFCNNYTKGNGAHANGGAIYSRFIELTDNEIVTFHGNIATTSSGGAIYGISNSTITLSNNGRVEFIANSASNGGAIYGAYNSIINLSDNGAVVFAENLGGAIDGGSIVLRDNVSVRFSSNSGTAVKAETLVLSNNETVTFNRNGLSSSNSSYGGAISGDDDSVVTISDNVTVAFIENFGTAINAGSIMLSNNDTMLFSGNAVNNSSSCYGGALRGVNNITLQGNGTVAVRENSVVGRSSYAHGGAIYGGGNSYITLVNNESVTFSGNTVSQSAYSYGGAICCGGGGDCTILLSNNGNVEFIANSVSGSSEAFGGAICDKYSIGNSEEGRTITLSNNEIVIFRGNSASCSASAGGGAIFGSPRGIIELINNESMSFIENSATSDTSYAFGGAICGDGATIILNESRIVTFSGNSVLSSSYHAKGGAIYGDFTLTGCEKVLFNENFAESSQSSGALGGAICGGIIELKGNTSITFSGNTICSSSSGHGGAIYGDSITLSNNDEVVFSENEASGANSASNGGAILSTSSVLLMDNEKITFIENTASNGGAILSTSSVLLMNNEKITFIENTASSRGGAIYGGNITLCNNETVIFRENATNGTSSTQGGAILSSGNLSIQNNESVLFEGNVEVYDGTYRLRGICLSNNGLKKEVTLSAAAGNKIEFRDSIFIDKGRTLNLNASYGEIKQDGDIIFTGATTVNDLYKVKGNIAGTEDEIRASRTSEINTVTNLYGGRLSVEDGAIYQGKGITVHKDSAATVRVKDAELSHVGYALEFNAGTALEVVGNSTIRGNVNLLTDSLFKLEKAASLSLHETLQADAAELTVQGTALLSGGATLNASLTFTDGATLDMYNLDAGAVTINGMLTFGGQVKLGDNLTFILNEMRGPNESVTLFTGIESLVLPVLASSEASNRVWVGDVFSNLVGYEQYYFNYVPDVGSLMVVHVPEPTTTTLGLLTLAGLALRRRRK